MRAQRRLCRTISGRKGREGGEEVAYRLEYLVSRLVPDWVEFLVAVDGLRVRSWRDLDDLAGIHLVAVRGIGDEDAL